VIGFGDTFAVLGVVLVAAAIGESIPVPQMSSEWHARRDSNS